jgi:hypothetical protein
MPRAQRTDLPVAIEMEGGFESRHAEWGGLNAAFQTFPPMDCTEFFKVLPNGSCAVPHWGYVISGSFRCKYPDREEVYKAGDAYYLSPGHIPVVDEKAQIVEFSPLEDLKGVLKALGLS